MSGSETVKDYVADCQLKGYPIQDPKFYKCRRPFRFGSGKVEHAQWCGTIPASFKHKSGTL
eukprot:9078423-Pyramimonas_sp.AAC.1